MSYRKISQSFEAKPVFNVSYRSEIWQASRQLRKFQSSMNILYPRGSVKYCHEMCYGLFWITSSKLEQWCCGPTGQRGYCERYLRSLVPEAGIKGRDKSSHPTDNVRCNYLSLSLIPASGTTPSHLYLKISSSKSHYDTTTMNSVLDSSGVWIVSLGISSS